MLLISQSIFCQAHDLAHDLVRTVVLGVVVVFAADDYEGREIDTECCQAVFST